MEISDRLQELRKSSHFTQEEIAAKLEVSRQAISKWESGQGNPEINNIIKLAEIYGVSTDFILMGKENHANVEPVQQKSVPKYEMSRTFKRMIAVIAIIGSTALITVLFIMALNVLAM